MIRMNPLLCTDVYKVGHVFQYPPKTEYVYSNLTPRSCRLDGVSEMIFFGLQAYIMRHLVHDFDNNFFWRPEEEVLDEYTEQVEAILGGPLPSYEHVRQLHQLGYLPVKIKALPEGTRVPIGIPCLTVVNTKPEFYWLTNFLETMLCTSLWQACVSATIADQYRRVLDYWAQKTGMPPDFVEIQGHDFSFRGMSSVETAAYSGMGHLLSFMGTDTIPAIIAAREYYLAGRDIGCSVAATEHSVMCAGGKESEIETFRRLMRTYPTGILSVVSDTWDLWQVVGEMLPVLKDEILAREGKLVIRPDSGDPVAICLELVPRLWDIFGGTTTPTGHKLLDPHIGAIYGDSITVERAKQIASGLAERGFASQMVLGIGSYTYQYNTRDTFGLAVKATHVVVDGEPRDIWKDPATDTSKTKKSARGLLCVRRDLENHTLVLDENCTPAMEERGELGVVYLDGSLRHFESFDSIRARVRGGRV
jgi:nicotinamide phosphoribosyltransferase